MTRYFSLHHLIRVLPLLLLFAACSPDDDSGPLTGGNDVNNNSGNPGNPGNTQDWLIPVGQVFDGGPGKDGIPSIDDPQFSHPSTITFMEPDDLILGFKVGDEIRGYPHPVLDWHEITNDVVGGKPIAVTYCPLTGTGIGWDRVLDGNTTTFGVSGLLFNNNLIPYDRATDSNWSQMLMKSVNGQQIGRDVATYQLFETSWETWTRLFPNAQVLNSNTGFSRSYGVYPYGSYKTNNELLLFPIEHEDDRLPNKERGLGVIIREEAIFYRFEDFSSGSVEVQHDRFQEQDLVIVGSQEQNFLLAFRRRMLDGVLLDFQPVTGEGAVIMQDQEGNKWNVFGEAVAGPRQGQKLNAPQAYIGYWFAWGTFFPDLEIGEF